MAFSIFRPAEQPLTPATERAYHWLAGGFFLALALVYYAPALGWLPRGIHEWAQADRLALAFGYFDRGMNFFKPRTLNLSSVDGVVGVEFPLVPYLAALLAKVTGRGSLVTWYRLLSISAAATSYYFLFRLVFERTRNFAAALLPGVFLATSPVFAYYAGNFLPDPVGASLTVVGAYYLLRFGRQPRYADAVAALLLLTLATLVKTSAGSYLLAAMGLLVLWTYLRPTLLPGLGQRLGLLALCVGSLALLVAVNRYNAYLNEAYQGNIFLASVVPIENQAQYDEVMERIREVWWEEYFTPANVLVLQLSAAVCVLSLWRILRTEWLWLSLLLLAAAGGYVFFRLFGRQLYVHDYYVLAPYWPGLALLVALAAVQLAGWRLPGGRWPLPLPLRVGQVALPALAAVALLALGLPKYRARTSVPYRTFSQYYGYPWMENGAQSLAAAQVPADATLLVVGELAPNLSLLYFDRRGITWPVEPAQFSADEALTRMRNYGLDYLLAQREVYDKLPPLTDRFRVVLRTDRFVLLAPLTPTR